LGNHCVECVDFGVNSFGHSHQDELLDFFTQMGDNPVKWLACGGNVNGRVVNGSSVRELPVDIVGGC